MNRSGGLIEKRGFGVLLLLRVVFSVFFGGMTAQAYPYPAQQIPPEKVCHFYASEMEKTHKIPDKLLTAVSLTESGRPTIKGLVAWPWTINVDGKGHYFSTKEAAIRAVRRLQKKRKKNFDVGCMQINLMHHPEAFKNLEQAFDPQTNVSYGARFLKNLKNTHKNWTKAVAHYHSATPACHIPYQKKVLKTWLEEKKKGKDPLVHMTVWSPEKRHHWPVKPAGGIRRLRPSPSPARVQRVQRSVLTPSVRTRSPKRRMAPQFVRHVPFGKVVSTIPPVRRITALKQE